jgi:hypothetical protein
LRVVQNMYTNIYNHISRDIHVMTGLTAVKQIKTKKIFRGHFLFNMFSVKFIR